MKMLKNGFEWALIIDARRNIPAGKIMFRRIVFSVNSKTEVVVMCFIFASHWRETAQNYE